MSLVNLNARTDHNKMVGEVLEILLLVIEHRLFDEPIRLSTDPGNEPLTIEPLVYGVRSAWRAPEGERAEYIFIVINARVPDDTSGAPAAAQLAIEMHDDRLADLLLSTIEPATVHMAMVTSDNLDEPERQWFDLEIESVDIAGGDITFTLSRDPTAELPYGAFRKVRDRFPGMHP